MEEALRALLLAGLPAMPAARVNWGEHPQDEGRPYIVMHMISLNEGRTQQGPDGLERGRVQVDCYAPTFAGARDMGRAVKEVLDFHRGGGFRGIFFDGMRLTRESDGTAGEAIYRASLDLLTNWRHDNVH